jgi:type IV pilus assembly protein PilE
MTSDKSRTDGFTLIEMLVVLAIVAILAALAWPAFTDAMNKSRRSDAMSALANITQAQERWRANNPGFQGDRSLLVGATSATSPGGHYDLAMVASSVSSTGYKANAAVRSGSPQVSDAACQFMQVEMSQGNIIYRSGPTSAVGNATPDPCWVR